MRNVKNLVTQNYYISLHGSATLSQSTKKNVAFCFLAHGFSKVLAQIHRWVREKGNFISHFFCPRFSVLSTVTTLKTSKSLLALVFTHPSLHPRYLGSIKIFREFRDISGNIHSFVVIPDNFQRVLAIPHVSSIVKILSLWPW